jgi:hypothetical protein
VHPALRYSEEQSRFAVSTPTYYLELSGQGRISIADVERGLMAWSLVSIIVHGIADRVARGVTAKRVVFSRAYASFIQGPSSSSALRNGRQRIIQPPKCRRRQESRSAGLKPFVGDTAPTILAAGEGPHARQEVRVKLGKK